MAGKTFIACMIAVVLGVSMTLIVRGFALRLGVVSHPNPIVPQHKNPVPYLGGVAIFLSAALGIILSGKFGDGAPRSADLVKTVGIPAMLFLSIGTLDDLKVFSPAVKLGLQAAVSALAVALGLAYPFSGIGILDAGMSFFWILLLVNAFNLTDVCDGLVAGLAVVALVFAGFLVQDWSIIAWIISGVCVGFLLFNSPQASIFLGDGGSHLLGFLVAAFLLSGTAQPVWPYVPQMILAVAVPLFEVVLLVTVRMQKQLPWWRGSPDHFALRLQKAGLSKWQTDITAWAAAVLICFAAVAMDALPGVWQAALLASIAVGLSVIWRILRRWDMQVT